MPAKTLGVARPQGAPGAKPPCSASNGAVPLARLAGALAGRCARCPARRPTGPCLPTVGSRAAASSGSRRGTPAYRYLSRGIGGGLPLPSVPLGQPAGAQNLRVPLHPAARPSLLLEHIRALSHAPGPPLQLEAAIQAVVGSGPDRRLDAGRGFGVGPAQVGPDGKQIVGEASQVVLQRLQPGAGLLAAAPCLGGARVLLGATAPRAAEGQRTVPSHADARAAVLARGRPLRTLVTYHLSRGFARGAGCAGRRKSRRAAPRTTRSDPPGPPSGARRPGKHLLKQQYRRRPQAVARRAACQTRSNSAGAR